MGGSPGSSRIWTKKKKNACKHSLGIAVRLKVFAVSDEAKTALVRKKCKRSRPPFATKALLRQ
jgi:hypothetical protein